MCDRLDTLVFPVLQGGIGGLVPALTPPDFLYIIGPLTIIGTLLFGIVTIRAHVFPVWLCLCLFVGYMPGLLGFIFLDKSAAFVGLLGIVLYWLSLSAFGVVLFSQPGPLSEMSAHPAVVSEVSSTLAYSQRSILRPPGSDWMPWGGHDRRGHPIAQTESEELKLRQDQRVMWENPLAPQMSPDSSKHLSYFARLGAWYLNITP